MQRFFVSSPLAIDLILTDPDIVHQLTRVMRIQTGESIVLFDGDGSEMLYEIGIITKKSIALRGIDRKFPKSEPERLITLYQALPNKLEKLEYILQKWVEVGIRKFIFFRSEYSQKLIISDAKKERLRAIAREALEQCGGLIMPEIEFREHIWDYAWWSKNMVLDTTGKMIKIHELPENKEIIIWTGPEGGWSEKERKKMQENSFLFVRFWERVLRTETAGVVTAFAFLYA